MHRVRRKLFVSALAGAIFASVSAIAVAQETANKYRDVGVYKLIAGRKHEICRDLEKNLKSFGVTRPSYSLPFNTKFKQFAELQWKPLDPAMNMEIIIKINGGIESDFKHPLSEEYRKRLEEKARAGDVRLEEVWVDFDHDGAKEQIYRFGYTWPWTNGEFLWNFWAPNNEKYLDKFHPFLHVCGSGGPTESFMHKGRFYFYCVEDDGPHRLGDFYKYRISVYETLLSLITKSYSFGSICEFTFNKVTGEP